MIFLNNNEKPSLEEALAHFGVKGMKWGVHKKRPEAVPRHSSYKSLQYNNDKRYHGKKGAEAINAKLHQGVSLKQARKEQMPITKKNRRRNMAIVLSAYAAWRLSPLFLSMLRSTLLKAAASKVARDGAKTAANLLANSHGLTKAATVNLAFNAAKNVWE